MGNRPLLAEVRAEARPRAVRRSLGGPVEQHDAGRHQDAEAGHDGPEGLPGRGADHEEAAPSEAHPAVRRVHDGGAHLHHHGAHEERLSARVPAGQGQAAQAAPADRHGRPNRGRHGLPGVPELHPQGLGCQERAGRR